MGISRTYLLDSLYNQDRLTLELLQHALHGAGAAAAGHGDVEFVVVLGHFGGW
jgi:hypothetical protein